jgi:hypothetical protein
VDAHHLAVEVHVGQAEARDFDPSLLRMEDSR